RFVDHYSSRIYNVPTILSIWHKCVCVRELVLWYTLGPLSRPNGPKLPPLRLPPSSTVSSLPFLFSHLVMFDCNIERSEAELNCKELRAWSQSRERRRRNSSALGWIDRCKRHSCQHILVQARAFAILQHEL